MKGSDRNVAEKGGIAIKSGRFWQVCKALKMRVKTVWCVTFNKIFETLTNINSLHFTNYHLHYTNLLLVNYHKGYKITIPIYKCTNIHRDCI